MGPYKFARSSVVDIMGRWGIKRLEFFKISDFFAVWL